MLSRCCVRGSGSCDKYCGRASGLWFGSVMANRFKIGVDGDRGEVIEKYKRWLWGKVKANDLEVMRWFKALRGDERLGCWCEAGEACHVDVIFKCWLYLKGVGDV